MTKPKLALIMQHPVHYFEEIRSLTLRLDSLLPGGTDYEEEERGPRVYGLCIRADPVSMDSLNLPSSEWRLAREIPASRQSQASRREFAREATTLQTCMSLGKVQHGCTAPPMGLSLWHTQSTRKLILIRHDLERMFELDKISSSMPYTDEQGYFALPGKRQLYFRDCVELIRESHPYLYGLCMEYAEMGCTMYGLSMQEFSSVSRLHISMCKSNVGRPLILQDSLQSRFDGGPIFIGSVGIPVTTYDLTPSLPAADRSAEPCTRVGVREGGLMVLDGDVRFRYACGIPKGQGGQNGVIYTLTIHMDSMEQTLVVGYENETKTIIMYTPLITRSEAIPHWVSPYPSPMERQKNTTLGQLIHKIRARVAIAESHVLREGYAANKGLSLVGRSLCAARKSPSRAMAE